MYFSVYTVILSGTADGNKTGACKQETVKKVNANPIIILICAPSPCTCRITCKHLGSDLTVVPKIHGYLISLLKHQPAGI